MRSTPAPDRTTRRAVRTAVVAVATVGAVASCSTGSDSTAETKDGPPSTIYPHNGHTGSAPPPLAPRAR